MKDTQAETGGTGMLKLTKAAWIRNGGYPVGVPSPGHFDCKCGCVVPCPVYGQAEPVTCAQCGTKYDGFGWIVSELDN